MIVQRNPQGLTQEESEAFARAVGGVDTARAARAWRGSPGRCPPPTSRSARCSGTRSARPRSPTSAFGPDLNLEERRDAAERFVGQLEPAPGARAGQTGPAPARLAQYDAIVGALPFITLGSILLIALIVGVHFRSWTAPLVTLAAAAIAYGVSLHVLGWAGEQAGVVMPREVEPVIVVLILGLVTDYAVFYLSAFRDAWGREGGSRFAAMRAATAGTSRVVLTAGRDRRRRHRVARRRRARLLPGLRPRPRDHGAHLGGGLPDVHPSLPGPVRPPARAAGGAGAPARRWPRPTRPIPGERLPEPLRVRLAGRLAALHAARRAADEHGFPRRRVVVARIVTAPAVAVPIVIACCAALLLAASGVRQLELGMTLVPSLPQDDPVRVAGEDARQGFAPGVTAPVEIVLERRGIGEELGALGELQERAARGARRRRRRRPAGGARRARGRRRGRRVTVARRASPCSSTTSPAARRRSTRWTGWSRACPR